MPYHADEWDMLAEDCHDSLAAVTITITQPGAGGLGELNHSTGLRSGMTTLLTAAIRATRDRLFTRPGPEGAGSPGRIEESEWTVMAADVIDIATATAFIPNPSGSLTETDEDATTATYQIKRVGIELGGRSFRLFGQRTL